MALTPEGWGRIQVCHACNNCVARAREPMSHCEGLLGERVALSYAFLNGPESNCPIRTTEYPEGKWKEVKPIDVPTLAIDMRERSITMAATNAIALLKAFGAAIPTTDVEIREGLSALVIAGNLPDDVAARVEDDLIAEKEAEEAHAL